MKRVIGFALFFVAVGILLGMLIPSGFMDVLCVVFCILCAYHMFCC